MADRDSLPPSCDTVTDLQQTSDHQHCSPPASEHGLTPPTSPLIMVPSSVQASPASPFMDDASTDDDMETYISLEDKSGNDCVPRKGMKFTSLEKFETFYHNSAISEGYTARIKRTIKFPHSDQIRYRQYVCSCEGFCKERKSNDKSDSDQEKVGRRTLTRRCGCLVSIIVSNKNGIWVVGKINKKHNHLLVSPNSRVYLKQPGRMPSVAKSLVEKFSKTDLHIGRVPDIVNCDASINVSQRDCWNYRRDLRRKNLDSGDANAVLVYCIEKKTQDPNFFYAIQTDEEDRMVNFFWIDSTARQYYERFGDVLVFDTTYKTNKYGLPLGNFVGVNNHSQSIMFGFALLQNEQEHTFVWLFKTWLHAVGGKTPISILTDQDRAIQNAIEKVFPTVTHRFCLWHIMTKFSERYGYLYKDNSPFCRDLNDCLYKSITTEQFDNEWKKIMEDNELVEDEWLNKLFEIRQSWVPVYNRIIFYVGMNTTQRCESIHSFFDAFLNKGTTLREFVIKYEHALEHRYRAEHAERFASLYKKPILSIKSPLEEHVADVYTRSIFNQFQKELEESLKLRKDKLEKSGSPNKHYKVSNFHNPDEAFVVSLNVESWDVSNIESWVISCQCHLFEFKGILCRHILAIFHKKDVVRIPPQYLLPRWTKKAGEGISIPLFKNVGDKSSTVRDLKFNNMMGKLRPYLHVSTKAFDIIMDDLDETFKKICKLEENQEGSDSAVVIVGRVENEVEQPSLANLPITKTKGRKRGDGSLSKNGRFKSGFEVRVENSKKPKRQCKNCGKYGHYSSTCERRKRTDMMDDATSED